MPKLRETHYSEAELIKVFGLTRLSGNQALPRLAQWTSAPAPVLSEADQRLFDDIAHEAQAKIAAWNEEERKMNFIAFVLRLGHLLGSSTFNTYFERPIAATIKGRRLKTKTDFMIAKGVLDMPETPYFHFQEWKKHKDPTGDPVAQLLEAFLIAQANNNDEKPLYGCTVTGKFWDFFVMEGATYAISKSYDCTEREELSQIIGMLQEFKRILETQLIKDN